MNLADLLLIALAGLAVTVAALLLWHDSASSWEDRR